MSEDILSRQPPPADVRLTYGSNPNQFIDLRLPADKAKVHPLLINIHGGFWRAKYGLEHAGHLCAAFTSQGFVTANLEYRRVGNEGGAWPGTFEDIRSAYKFLLQNAEKHHANSQKVVIMGHSAGGQLALCLAGHEPSVKRVVSLAGVVDLEKAYQLHLSNDAVVEFLRGTPVEVPDHYREANPMKLSITEAYQWLIHGSADDTVPPQFSRDYIAAKNRRKPGQKEDAHLLEIVGADHYDLIDPRSRAWEQIQKTVTELVI
ncbi:MAG TPA: alpha/beta fold hydrolase [Candidatus Eisenbacteria bacterium]|nr:alpha/beta fold hydrolase [Candidatus Eisenbacteria bacterium]